MVNFNRLLPSAIFIFLSSTLLADPNSPRLERVSYQSAATGLERDYFVYLPNDFDERERWPVIMFLHGNGERGNGKDELDFVLVHGVLYEAWVQKRDLPFVVIAPQLPMFDQGEVGYIKNRKKQNIPRRLSVGVPDRPAGFGQEALMQGQLAEDTPYPPEGMPQGWFLLEDELLGMLDHTVQHFKGDASRTYLTGLSYGGYGTWHMAATHPDRFAAVAPVVGHGHPAHAVPIAAAGLPLWQFAGGKDSVVPVRHFYGALNALEKLGHSEVRFRIEADLGHSAWVRIYAGEELYRWFLDHRIPH